MANPEQLLYKEESLGAGLDLLGPLTIEGGAGLQIADRQSR